MSITRKALSYLQFKFKKNIYRNSVFNFRNDVNKRELHSYSDSDVSSVTVSDMRRILRLHGFATEDGFTCLLTKCPICKNLSNFVKNPGQAYINKTTGFFLCPMCDYSGQWNALEKVIKKPKELANQNIEDIFKITSRGFENKWEELVKNTDTFSKLEDYEIQEILKQFNLPIFPDVSKVLGDVRLSTDQQYLYFPLQDLANRNVGYVICQTDTSLYTTKPDENCGGLLWFKGGRSHSKDNPVIIVPTIGDALALVAQRISGSVVCLPYGLKNLPQQALPALEKSSKLILWAGSDSIEHVRALARKLGETRCLVIRAAGLQSTAQEAFRNNLDLKTIIASAHSVWHKSVTTFKSLREDVLADLKNIEKVQGIKWRRYPTLNKLLHGHRRGELTVLTGPTGCGKTTFCSEYSLDLAQQGVNTLWGSFEIRNARLVRTMLQQLAGFPLEKNLDQFDKYADMFQQLPLYFLMFHGQQTIKDVMEAVEHASYVHDIAHVIIDNVQFMLGVGDVQTKSSDRFWRQDAVIASFRTFATRTNCHVTLVMHPRKERDADDLSTNSIFGSAKASQEADNVLIIQDKRLTTLRGKKYLQIAKNRYSGDLGIMPLEFDKNGLSYSQKKKTVQKENIPISE